MVFDSVFTNNMNSCQQIDYSDYCKKRKLTELLRCPVCDLNVHFELVCQLSIDNNIYYTILQCPNCNQIIIQKWKSDDRETESECLEVYPVNRAGREFDDDLKKLSPIFCKVYNQALMAETYGLDEIAGMGYRKAVEFLVKDYAIKAHQEETEKIKVKPLGKCIDEYIDYPKIKSMAKGAVYLGNDETHYVRKWENKDIKDLKIMINLILHWIEIEKLTQQYEQDMHL